MEQQPVAGQRGRPSVVVALARATTRPAGAAGGSGVATRAVAASSVAAPNDPASETATASAAAGSVKA